jgi:hypothetical protein
MKKAILGFTALFAALLTMAQDGRYNDPNAETRQVASFTGIKVSTGIEMVLSQGNEQAVAVSAGDVEDRDRIKTEVKDGVLKIYYDGKAYNKKRKSTSKLKAYVSVVSLRSLHATAGAVIKVDGTLKADDLEIDLSAGAHLQGSLSVGQMTVSQNSGALARLSGNARQLRLSVSSGANFRGYEFAAEKCNIGANSGGNVEITVNEELEAKANSGSNVRYKGGCRLVGAQTSSGGSIKSKA